MTTDDASFRPSPRAVRFVQDEVVRWRSVGVQVRVGDVDVPAPPVVLQADWARDVRAQLALQAGDVEPLSLPRARRRWPDYARCVDAMAGWLAGLGLPGILDGGEVALMACRGAAEHHDADHYGGAAFCNLFLSDDVGLEVHFPQASGGGLRVPLRRGTVMLFDTAQPHAVVRRDRGVFDERDFGEDVDCTQVFLSWELPIVHPRLAQVLQLTLQPLTGHAERADRPALSNWPVP